MKLMILDGNSVINRAFYGIRPLTTRDGLPTNAIFGFLNILHRVEAEESPDALCVAFDLKAPTFRHKQYDGYKATRHAMPEELAQQMPVMKEVLQALRIPIFECEGWEADDVIGTVARVCTEAAWDCVIVTGDRDSLQLVGDRVTVKLVITKSGQTTSTNYTPQLFQAEYGFAPPILIDLKALMGDHSDNIPGVAGVGPKSATELLLRFGTLAGIYENLQDDTIRPKLREKLEAGREMAFLSYELATIRTDAPIVFLPEACRCQEPDRAALCELFARLEFVKLMARYDLHPPVDAAAPAPVLTELTSLPAPGTPCAMAWSDDLSQAAVATAAGVCFVDAAENRDALQALLQAATPKYCHDCKTLLHRLLDAGYAPDGFAFDTALAAYLLDPAGSDYSLPRLAVQYLAAPLDGESLAQQAAAIWRLQAPLRAQLADQGMLDLLLQLELPLCRVLAQMERVGVAVDEAALVAFGQMLQGEIDRSSGEVYRYAGEEFNINSPKKLGQILFEQLELPHGKKTKTGYSTNAEVLEKLKGKHPIVAEILRYRMLTKLKSTYADGLLKVIASDGRIHTTFQNTVTATGRLSSTDPNLQNIPVRTELGSELRRMFVAQPGWVLVDADYSQIELRVLAHVADDKNMQAAFLSGEDFHTVTAAQVFGVPVEEVTPEMRRSAKAVNFGIVYGISDWALAEDLGVSVAEAKAYIEGYLARFAGVRAYRENIVAEGREKGYVTTLLGRRRPLPELHSKNFNIRTGAERMALNTPIQGAAADIIKVAMLRVDGALRRQALQARLVLQIHDELIVECPPWEAELVMQIVTEEMARAMELAVPLKAEAKMGATWYEAK